LLLHTLADTLGVRAQHANWLKLDKKVMGVWQAAGEIWQDDDIRFMREKVLARHFFWSESG
jgi:hypothetical protein